jgi:hypothetical protein
VLEKIDYYQSRFFWQPREQGGLGVLNIEVQNKCLLSKWLFKLINEDGMWQEILRKNISQTKQLGRHKRNRVTPNFGLG